MRKTSNSGEAQPGEAQPSKAQLIEHVHSLSAFLAYGYKPEEVPPERLENGTIRLGWFNYDRRVWDGLAAAQALLGTDLSYPQHITAVRERGIPAASSSDLSTWFTWMSRSERFCEGFLASNIADGELAAITKRLEALIASGEVAYTPSDS